MLSLDSTLTAEDIESILKNTAVDINSLNPSYAGKIGAGRIDAGAAMAAVASSMTVRDNKQIPIRIHPNPSQGDFSIGLMSAAEEEVEILIRDLHGRSVHCEKVHTFCGQQTIQVDISGILPGTYLVSLTSLYQTSSALLVVLSK
jgi:hypothetical protein